MEFVAIPKPEPRDWQLANAQILQVTDREVLAVLRNAKKNVDAILAALPAGTSEIRRAQLEQSRSRLLAEQSALFERLGDVVSARRAAAASRSARLSAAGDAALLRAVGKGAEAQFLYDSALETSQRAIDTALARLKLSALPLSRRIYNTSVWMNGRLSRMISETMATGLNAREFAKKARDWFNPNTPGGVRFAAMRLARTEINNAFHAMSAQKYATTPWVTQVDWNLSKSHPKPDICNEVHADSPFDKDKVPARPHPQCMCYITPTTVDEDEFIDRFINGEYDDYLDKELAANGWDVKDPDPVVKPQPTPVAPTPQPEQKVTRTLSGEEALASVPKGLYKQGSMTPEQRKALQTYETGWFAVINGFLREERWGNKEDWREERDVKLIDSAMTESVLPNDVQVWRGMFRSSTVFGDDMKDKNLTGFAWEEKGYSSTTANEKIVDTFNVPQDREFEALKGQNVKMTVTVPAGTQALATSTFEKGSPANGPQAELTLQRGMKWTVVKDNGYDANGVRQLEVRADPIGREDDSSRTNAGTPSSGLQPANPQPTGQPISASPGGDGPELSEQTWDQLSKLLDEAKANPKPLVKKERVKPVKRPDGAKIAGRGRVEAPAEESRNVQLLGYKISDKIPKALHTKIKRVAAIHETRIGDAIQRISAVESGIPKQSGRDAKATFAIAYYDSGAVHLHSGFNAKGDAMAGCVHSHHFVGGGDDAHETVLAHEFGHVFLSQGRLDLDGLNTLISTIGRVLKLPNQATAPATDRAMAMRAFDALVKNQDNESTIHKKVSKYSTKNANEFLAEIWAEYTMNPDASDEIREIGSLMEDFITKRKKGLSALTY